MVAKEGTANMGKAATGGKGGDGLWVAAREATEVMPSHNPGCKFFGPRLGPESGALTFIDGFMRHCQRGG